MKNVQLGFLDTENRYERLTQLGDPLKKLKKAINWEMFREKLAAVCQKDDNTKGGRPSIDVIIKFKATVLRRIYTCPRQNLLKNPRTVPMRTRS